MKATTPGTGAKKPDCLHDLKPCPRRKCGANRAKHYIQSAESQLLTEGSTTSNSNVLGSETLALVDRKSREI